MVNVWFFMISLKITFSLTIKIMSLISYSLQPNEYKKLVNMFMQILPAAKKVRNKLIETIIYVFILEFLLKNNLLRV